MIIGDPDAVAQELAKLSKAGLRGIGIGKPFHTFAPHLADSGTERQQQK